MTAHADKQAVPITVRDRRFPRQARQRGADPVAAAWFTALSASFPRGEAMFVDAVRACREGAGEPLGSEIRAFIRQEVNHSREHLAFNRKTADAGYDLSQVDARVADLVAQTQSNPPIVQLAITMALEHFTAMFAHLFLTNPHSLASEGMGEKQLWLWHAAEEIEHKGVAFDTWLHATRSWPARRRYMVRSLVMLNVTWRFLRNRWIDAMELMGQDGLTHWQAGSGLARFLWWKPGPLRRILPAWLGYFRPGFHPWQVDDRHLIARYDSEFADANLPSEVAQFPQAAAPIGASS